MKIKTRLFSALILIGLMLSACNFSLAEDITPPPGYKSPTPPPTIGPLYPPFPPSPARGAAIYAEQCAPCHGEKGLGNGPQAAGLPVPVIAIGLPEIARQSTPAGWFTILSRGRVDRNMPPFTNLTPEERWDVIAYVYILSTSPEEIQHGAVIYAEKCAACHGPQGKGDGLAASGLSTPPMNFSNQNFMSQTTGIGLHRAIFEGVTPAMPAFGSALGEGDIWALVAYLRSLTFDMTAPTATPEPTSTTEPATANPTLVPTETAPTLPPVEVSPTSATPEATASGEISPTPEFIATSIPATGAVTGTVSHGFSGVLPEGLTVTLRGFDLVQDTGSMPQEVVNLSAAVQPGGTFIFEDVEMPDGRIFLAEVEYNGIPFQSDFASVEKGALQLTLSPVVIYETTTDFSILHLDQVHIALDFSVPEVIQVYEIYVLSNPGEAAVVVASDGLTILFIQPPAQVENVGFSLAEGSAPLLPASEGFALLPGDQQYGIVVSFTLPYEKKLELVQPFVLPATSVFVFVPDGVKVRSDQLSDAGVRSIQNATYRMYKAENLLAGASLTLTISGRPKSASGLAVDTQTSLVIGLSIFGVALILAGVYFFLRERSQAGEEEVEEDALGEDTDSLIDAIVALDDQYKAGGISDEAYRKRRAELKARLKELL